MKEKLKNATLFQTTHSFPNFVAAFGYSAIFSSGTRGVQTLSWYKKVFRRFFNLY
jgi:hypothetical protein